MRISGEGVEMTPGLSIGDSGLPEAFYIFEEGQGPVTQATMASP